MTFLNSFFTVTTALWLTYIFIGLIVFIIMRSVWLWYWRINDFVDSMQSIAESFKKIADKK